MTRLRLIERLRAILLGAATLLASTAGARTQDHEAILRDVYRRAIVKVDVSSNTPVFHETKNLCVSEGTGFVVNRRTVITADHVMAIPAECGTPIILIRSRLHNVERLATKSGSRDDVAVLTLPEDLPERVCSLRVRTGDSYNQKGFRFGIPGGFPDPVPVPVETGFPDGPFNPLVVLRPDDANFGESGGPVIVLYNVVGILRAKLPHTTGLSVMIPAQMVRGMMLESQVGEDQNVCNPSNWAVSVTNDVNVSGRLYVNTAYDPKLQAKLAPELRDAFRLANAESRAWSVKPTINLDRFGGTLQSNVDPITAPTPVDPKDTTLLQAYNSRHVGMVLQDVQRSFEVALWKKLIAEGTAKGLWNRDPARAGGRR